MTRNLPFSSRRRFRISTTNSNYLEGSKVSDICQFVLKRRVDSPSPIWNISRHLSTTTCGLTKNFQPLLRQVRHYILSDDSLEYWHLTPEFSSGNIILLTWRIMPHSKPKSSPSFGLRTKTEMLRLSSPLKENKKNTIGWGLMDPINWNYTRKFEPLLFFWLPLAICTRGHKGN